MALVLLCNQFAQIRECYPVPKAPSCSLDDFDEHVADWNVTSRITNSRPKGVAVLVENTH